MASPSNNVLYTGMSTMLLERVQSHKDKMIDGFAKKYSCTKLVYFEVTDDEQTALIREKEIKGWSRGKKAALIGMRNAEWRDLFDDLLNTVAGL